MFDTALHRITGCDTRIKEATEYSLSMGAALKSIIDAENRVLTSLPDWVEPSPADTKKSRVSLSPNCFACLIVSSSSLLLDKKRVDWFSTIRRKLFHLRDEDALQTNETITLSVSHFVTTSILSLEIQAVFFYTA